MGNHFQIVGEQKVGKGSNDRQRRGVLWAGKPPMTVVGVLPGRESEG